MIDLETAMMQQWERVRRFRMGVLLTIYALISVFTFGYRTSEPMLYCREGVQVPPDDYSRRAVSSLVVAPLWPLYWAWEAGEKIRGLDAISAQYPTSKDGNPCAWQKAVES